MLAWVQLTIELKIAFAFGSVLRYKSCHSNSEDEDLEPTLLFKNFEIYVFPASDVHCIVLQLLSYEMLLSMIRALSFWTALVKITCLITEHLQDFHTTVTFSLVNV